MSDTPTQPGISVELASQGRYYKSGSSKAVLQTLRGEYEAMLADATAQTFPTVSNNVLKDLVVEHPAESFDKLLIGDKYHLLFQLRILSYPGDRGRKYGCTVTCPNCAHPNALDIDLIQRIETKHPPEGAVEPFTVDLPVCGRVAKLRLLRVFDESEMVTFVRHHRRKKELRGDPAYFYALARGLLSLDDEQLEFDEAVEFVRQAPAGDTLALKDALDDHDVGPELDIDFTCEECGHYWWQRMPLGADFFRPGVAERRRNTRSKV